MKPARNKLGRFAWSCVLGAASTAAGLLGISATGCGADYGPQPYESLPGRDANWNTGWVDAAYGPPPARDANEWYPDAAYGPPSCMTDEDCGRYGMSWYCDDSKTCTSNPRPDGGEDGGR